MQNRLRECRKEAKLTQAELAEKSGVCRTVISGIEAGVYDVTTTKTLRKLSAALNKSVGEGFFT